MSASVWDVYLRFEIKAPSRLPALERVVAALARIKANQWAEDVDEDDESLWVAEDEPWRGFLDDEARAHFARAFDFGSEEGKLWNRLWNLTHHSKRRDPIFNLPGPWDYLSVIDSIYVKECLLGEVVQVGPALAELHIETWSCPFGGTESLVELIEGFGQLVIHDSWHEGPHSRRLVGWDPIRARELVEAGRGIE